MTTEKTTTEQRQQTCEERIDARLASRLAQFTFDASSATLDDCREKLNDYGRGYPSDFDVFAADADGLAQILQNAGYDGGNDKLDSVIRRWYADATAGDDCDDIDSAVEYLADSGCYSADVSDDDRAAFVDAMDCGDLDGLDDWREAAEDADRDGALEGILCVDKKTVYSVQLSTGGPADSVEIEYDSDGDVCGGWYVFQDWFDGARRQIDSATAEQLAEKFGLYHEKS